MYCKRTNEAHSSAQPWRLNLQKAYNVGQRMGVTSLPDMGEYEPIALTNEDLTEFIRSEAMIPDFELISIPDRQEHIE